MQYVGLSLLCALLGNVPLFAKKKFIHGAIAGVAEFLIGWLIFYCATPTTVWPLFGGYGGTVAIWWVVAAVVDFTGDEERSWSMLFPAAAIVLYLGYGFAGSQFLRTEAYKNLIGTVEERVWTQDVQPKDPKHMRMVSKENALYQAQKVLGSDGAIGSQFELATKYMTLQKVRNELWYVAPLDFRGFSVWSSTNGVPAFVMIHGEDAKQKPVMKNLPEGQLMRYMPGAYFWDDLERYVRAHGYLDRGLDNFNFEIDDNDKPWWVITVFSPTIVWNGEKTDGILLVDPVSGAIEFYALGQIPEWVDRAVPADYIKSYLELNGEYVNGWKNSWWGQLGVTKPEAPVLIYGAEGKPEFVTGMTSHSSKDDSLTALVYSDTRTGKSVRYQVAGGATDTAVINAVNSNTNVQFRHLHATVPQIYNVYGNMTCVVVLLNDINAFQGVAMVPINNVQTVAFGEDQYSALREYEKQLSGSGAQVTLDKERDLKEVTGTVDRFNQEILSSGQTYYLHLVGIPHIFTGGAGELSPKLPLTKPGDQVKIGFYASDRDVVPMHGFDNLSLPLTQTADQKAVHAAGEARRADTETNEDAKTALERIKKLSPKQILELSKGAK